MNYFVKEKQYNGIHTISEYNHVLICHVSVALGALLGMMWIPKGPEV